MAIQEDRLMSEQNDRRGIGWVRPELERLLESVRDALQRTSEGDPDANLSEAVVALHQSWGALAMVEAHAAAEVAHGMEAVAEALRDEQVPDRAAAIDALMHAVVELPTLLQAMEQGEPVGSLSALSTALRAVLGLDPPSNMREPDLQPLRKATLPGVYEQFAASDSQGVARRVRAGFQQCLVNVLRGNDPTRTGLRLMKIIAAVQRICRGSPHERLWWLFGGLVEAVQHVPGTLQRRGVQTLRRMDNELRALAVNGVEALKQPVPEDLAREILTLLGELGVRSQRIDAVMEAFGLGTRNDSLARVGREAVASAAKVLVEELGTIKERLDTYSASELRNVQELEALREPLRRIAGTLDLLGLGALEAVLSEQYTRVDLATSRGRISDDELMSLAEALMGVEEELRVIASADTDQGSTAEARKAVIREARIGLDEVKLAIVDFIGKKWDHSVIDSVPALLRAVRGGLDMLDLSRPALLVGECRRYVEDELLTQRTVPEWEALDRLADAITSLDYYLERFMETRGKSDERVLELAWESVYSLTNGIGATMPTASGAEAKYPSFLPPQHLPKAVEWPAAAPAPEPDMNALAAVGWNQAASSSQAASAPPSALRADREPAPAPVGPRALPVEFPNDPDIVPVFEEEMAEVLSLVDASLPRLRTDLADGDAARDVRRAFHTLKGGARMVGANTLGELAWAVERALNPVLEGSAHFTAAHLALVEAARVVLPEFGAAFVSGRVPAADPDHIEHLAAVAEGNAVAAPVRSQADDVVELTPLPDDESGADASLTGMVEDADAELLELFRGEAARHLEAINSALFTARDGEPLPEPLTRAAHTLRGSAGAAGALAVHRIADAFDAWLGGRRAWQPGDVVLAQEVLSCLRGEVARAPAALPMAATLEVIEQLASSEPVPATAAGAPEGPRAVLQRWADGEDMEPALARLREELAGVAAEQDSAEATEVALALVGVYDVLDLTMLPDPAALAALQAGHGALETLLAQIGGGEEPVAQPAVVQQLRQVEDRLIEALSFGDDDAPGEAGADAAPPLAGVPDAQAAQAQDAQLPEVRVPEDVDRDLLVVFHEEATELLEAIESRIESWCDEPGNQLHREHILRALHTLKGGARLAGLMGLGDETHALESRVQALSPEDAAQPERVHELMAGHDALARWLPPIRDVCFAPAPRAEARREAASTARAPSVSPTPAAATPHEPAGSTADAASGSFDLPMDAAQAEPATTASAAPAERPSQEMIRVASSLLEQLVDLAGESAIARARISEVIGELTHVIDEMGMTVRRVRDQVRRLEIETETQVLSTQVMARRERADSPDYADFDPLEMDRYSQLQQLARGLNEAGSDLLDLQETIRGRAREADGLLAQQARLNTELQEGLMRTRMVPFTRLAPRLNRIVRTISQELGKQVQLLVSASAGELDRSVLERMIPPLEHMLRNAVDHGIESPARRRELGKPETGRVQIRLQREASEIVIEIADDGAGIDPESVRRKAIERGLMAQDARLSDRDVLGFIFNAGFSTAHEITQISGRGVGMDVAASEVKQLGGSIDLQSVPGRGTRFTIRLPFTVSVNRALMVMVGDDMYAVPLNSIEGIVRATPNELVAQYATDTPSFSYAGMDYQLGYLGSLLARERMVRTDVTSLPVLLTRSGDEAVAVHVDAVHGSREIVVKSLGPQFAGVSGVSGATLLGDGSVVVILDLPGLIRRRAHDRDAAAEVLPLKHDRSGLCVMVVDDSVTVRKVTSRLLERQGFEVLLAKDGVEAVAQLQERRPDVMLLDIEMPRMDGFEVAQHVRHDERYSALPIIMISSRTGQKHRDRATQIGVDRFLGKPFQESDLLASIQELTDGRSDA
jgi:chemosensory pili system protein ChpA (sensor histidine kinase/response regulator)